MAAPDSTLNTADGSKALKLPRSEAARQARNAASRRALRHSVWRAALLAHATAAGLHVRRLRLARARHGGVAVRS